MMRWHQLLTDAAEAGLPLNSDWHTPTEPPSCVLQNHVVHNDLMGRLDTEGVDDKSHCGQWADHERLLRIDGR